MGSRPQVEGTVSQDYSDDSTHYRNAPQLTAALLSRGENRFDIFCSPCHGKAGYGDGMIVRRGFSKPPDFHTDSLRAKSDKELIAIISQGFGSMPDYATELPPADEWAVVAYIRALQLSQHANLSDIPESTRNKVR
jgi:mono/diheme cytochrome c family protein